MQSFFLILGLSFLLIAPTSSKANEPVIRIPAVSGQVQLDGILDDPLWQLAKSLTLTMSQPIYGSAPSNSTSLKIAHNHDALYVSGYFSYGSATDTSPQLTRDDLDYSSDLFGLVIDGYNDGENAYVFITSPSGNKTDLTVSNDAESPKNLNWDTFWSVEVDKNDTYWSFEMRIPLSSLQYQQQGGKIVVGLSAWKYTADNNEFDTFPLISDEYGVNGYFKPSQTADFSFSYVETTRPFNMSPYLLGGYDHQTIESGNQHGDLLLDAGLDLKYKLSSNFTVDATLNTDFAQVENDNQRINLSRFALYQEEKRSFFQERAGLFSFNTGGPTTLFYSRRIGLTDDGRQVPLYGGGRLTGRSNGWDVGMLSMQSAPKHGMESENFSVLRIRKNIDKGNSSYIGVISTSRISKDGSYNVAYGTDIVWEAPRDVFITERYAQTINDPLTKSYSETSWSNTTNLLLSAERRSYVGLFYTFSVNRVGKNYNPGLGFLDRSDFTRYGDRIAYGWVAPESSLFQKYQLITDAHIYVGNTTKEIESSSVSIKNYTSFKSGFSMQFGLKRQTERLYDGYSLSHEVNIPSGKYSFGELFFVFSSAEGHRFRFGNTASIGSFFDGKGVAVSLSPEWTINSQFALSGDLEFYDIDFENRNQHYRSLLVRGRLDFKPTPHISISGLTQYNDLTKVFSSFARLRFNIRDGSDLFVVYRYGQNSSPLEHLNRTDFTNISSLQAKFSYTFRY